ncbi:integrase catalytic domain-containing protein [Trichonephila clavipes]|nr:integrase catalytic domain-containing protein [Trichonephila clavipes]
MLFPLVDSCLPAEILSARERYVGYSSDESETESTSIENSTTASSSSSNVLANQACTSEVLLQTLVIMLQNGNHWNLIGVREQDRDFLRFMRQDKENSDHIKIYRHRRVVFGVTSSPFLLDATLNHHLDNACGNFDNVAKILKKSFYVDNSHFNLRGWQSNVLLNPEKFSELESHPDNFETMVLGLIWNLKEECLSCNINCQKNEGVDLGGPLHLKDKRKGWVVLFTCAVFRAAHFELITSLSTAAFLQSLRRFISRRGRPTIIYSDNGTNFVGSNSVLNSIDWDVVMSKANIQKIKWKFNPYNVAWWGGFGERMVQMLKQILRKMLGRASLYYEELDTVLWECEHM